MHTHGKLVFNIAIRVYTDIVSGQKRVTEKDEKITASYSTYSMHECKYIHE